MILILSEQSDSSTTHIIEWLQYFNKSYFRINKEDDLQIEYIGNDIIFNIGYQKIKLSEITSCWYRRGYLNPKFKFLGIDAFDSFHQNEKKQLLEYIYYKLDSLPHINSLKNANVNKLIINSIANQCGITTPKDLIFSTKKSLKKYFNKNPNDHITKTIAGDPTRSFKDFIIQIYTSKIDLDKLETENFFPSLVQNYIEKKYELRIFYLEGEFYSMAIFSQNDNQTSIDFRNYNLVKPNRTVPYKLPAELEIKIDSLMRKIDLNCGSIDMIVTPKNEYVFLEVNPVGQFGMTSYPCNYNLEKRIAKYLI